MANQEQEEDMMNNTTVSGLENAVLSHRASARPMRELLRHVAPEEIPASEDLFAREVLERHLTTLAEPPFSLMAVGDMMLGGRTRHVIATYGADYPFEAVLPLLRPTENVVGEPDGPGARQALRGRPHYSDAGNPQLAPSFAPAGVGVVALADHHPP